MDNSPLDSGHAVPVPVPVAPNGVDTINHIAPNGDIDPPLKSTRASSPHTDSPATPISNILAPDVKIDIDYQEQESDVRHEPILIKQNDPLEKPDTASTIPQVGTPVDPSSIPIRPLSGTPPPPSGQLLEDVRMAEEAPATTSNGITHDASNNDVVMHDADAETPTTTPAVVKADSAAPDVEHTSVSPSFSNPAEPPPSQDDEDDQPPPAKRARMQSEHDEPVPNSATPPPESATISTISTPAPPPSASTPATTLSPAQFRFCQSTIRSLKKLKDAGPFLRPVDHVALNIPHYPNIIKTPMDFSTIERKLVSSNPNKPDPNPANPRYYNTDDFVSDVRLIFQNCIAFNGPDHAVSQMGKRVEQVFDKQIKQMPAPVEVKPPVVKKPATPPPPPPPVVPPKKPATTTVAARRPSTSVPVIRRSDTEAIGRPKREIHPPPPKDLAYSDAPKKARRTKLSKDDGTADQLKFCSKLLTDLHKKQYAAIASPFYEPVDWVKLEIPSYPKLVKKPMDLSTMRKKLDSGLYPTANKFFDDFKLMIRNCFVFNPAGTPVNQAGIELQRVFDEKWKGLPPLRDVASEDEEDEEEDDSEEERQRAIAMMESQIEAMRGNIAALKHNRLPKEKKKKEKRDKPPVASSSKASTKPPKASSLKKKIKKPITDNDVLTFEQKKDLSETIAKLDETKLEKVIQIIHEGVPEIRDSTEEIELEIDLLPAPVLTKLYNFVIRPLRAPPVKRSRPGKGTGTGGLKRKSMDEDVEAEKIRLLEERMLLFDRKANGGAGLPPPREDSDRSSDSSDSESSGSDSE